MHPRQLGAAWVRPPLVAARSAREPRAPSREGEPAQGLFARSPRAMAPPSTQLVPTAEEMVRLGVLPRVHRMTRAEWDAWNAADESVKGETRRAMREAMKEAGGGELFDHRGRLVERIG